MVLTAEEDWKPRDINSPWEWRNFWRFYSTESLEEELSLNPITAERIVGLQDETHLSLRMRDFSGDTFGSSVCKGIYKGKPWYHMEINQNLPLSEQRLTYAHEIVHILCRGGAVRNSWCYESVEEVIEQEAIRILRDFPNELKNLYLNKVVLM